MNDIFHDDDEHPVVAANTRLLMAEILTACQDRCTRLPQDPMVVNSVTICALVNATAFVLLRAYPIASQRERWVKATQELLEHCVAHQVTIAPEKGLDPRA